LIQKDLKADNMRKKYVIKNLLNNQYFYGFYTNKQWTDELRDAKIFENYTLEEMIDYLNSNQEIFGGKYIDFISFYN
jgi:hypothetical protein